MLNHVMPNTVEWRLKKGGHDSDYPKYDYLGPKDGYFMFAVEDIPAGEQINGSYGAKPNDDLFRSYGFTAPDNEAKIQLFFRLTLVQGSDRLFAQKVSLLSRH